MKKIGILLLALLCAGFQGFSQSSDIVSRSLYPTDIDFDNKIIKIALADFFEVSPLDGNMVLVVPTKKAIKKFGGKSSDALILSNYLKDYCLSLGTPLWIVDDLPHLKDMCAIVELPDASTESAETTAEPSGESNDE